MDENPEGSSLQTICVENPTSPQALPAQAADNESDETETDYDALLSKIPGFQTYDYNSTPSTRHGQDFPRKSGTGKQQTQHQITEERSPTRNGTLNQRTYHFRNANLSLSDSAGRRTSSGPQDRFSVHVLAGVVPQLYDISRKRNRLLQLEFKIENVHRKLARARESLLKELENADNVLRHESLSVGDLRRKWRRHSKRLRRCSQELAKEEAVLEPLQQKLTQAQQDVITLEDNLHASLTGGTKPGDSDASFEDRLFETAGQQSDLHPMITIEPLAGDDFYNEVLIENLQASGVPTMSVTASDNQIEVNLDDGLLQGRQLSPDTGRTELRKNSTLKSENAVNDSQVLDESRRERSNRFFEITFCGSRFQENLQDYISQAAQASQLQADPALVKIRKNDLEAALGYPLQDLDINMKMINKSKKPMNSGVAHALTEANLPRVHTRQMISLWGTAMSQNSAYETLRTLLYGDRNFEQLTGQHRSLLKAIRSNPAVVLRLVQDVRQLKVPLDVTMGENDAFLKVDRDPTGAVDDIGEETLYNTVSRDNDSLFVNVASTDNPAELGSSIIQTQEQYQDAQH